MNWNWQQQDWPNFRYDKKVLEPLETTFLLKAGVLLGSYAHINQEEQNALTVELISEEALKTSEIEGEYLNRDSVQSSIRRHLGFANDHRKVPAAEQGIAELMVDLYKNFASELSHDTLFTWHKMITNGRRDLQDLGAYRTHLEPMQVVSGQFYEPKVHFEAPPSKTIPYHMEKFIEWFNHTAPQGHEPLPFLTRAAMAHWYFVCIHPFEDGNGRIGRGLAEKSLSQCLGQPTLIALSHIIQKYKKNYYSMLEQSNKSNEITAYLVYFSEVILEAQAYTQKMINFLIEKAKLHDRVRGELNARQERVIERMFREGLGGFKGGLSADNYIRITHTSRATTTRDLQDLVEKKVLVRTGEHKSTRYYLNINIY
jgi:Fic family protein